ncbi:MAG: hypothetical protein R2838_24595 [Caldilineaceae bacterium]
MTSPAAYHGWIALAPCRWEPDTRSLRRLERLPDGRGGADGTRHVGPGLGVLCGHTADAGRGRAGARGLRWMLKLDEDLAPFYAWPRRSTRGIWRTVHDGRGRLLRSPTLWEDVVKTICTTNITWTQTKGMVQRWWMRWARVAGRPRSAFPTPAQVLDGGEAIFAETVRMGLSCAYVLQKGTCWEVVSGARDLEALRGRPIYRLRP